MIDTAKEPGTPAPDRAMLRRYFQALYETSEGFPGAVNLYGSNGDGKPRGVRFIAPTDIDSLVNAAVELAGRLDVYCGIDLIRPAAVDGIRARHGRGREAELAYCVALRADIDGQKPGASAKGHNYPPRERILEALDRMPLPASMVVGSGSSGVHAYWFFQEPVETSDQSRPWLKRVAEAWQGLLRSRLGCDDKGHPYDLDKTHDLTRVLRPAGSINHKHGQPVEFLLYEPSRRYAVDQFEAFLFDLMAGPSGSDPGEPVDVTPVGAERGSVLEQARWRLSRIEPPAMGEGYDRTTFHAACVLTLGYALSIDEALPLLSEWNEGCRPPWSGKDLLHKLTDASKRPGPRGYLVAAEKAPAFANVTWAKDEKGDAVAVPIPMGKVIENLFSATDGWPRRVGGALFVHESGDSIDWLTRAPNMFGWVARRVGTVKWYAQIGCVGKEELFCEVGRTATKYEAVETLPHYPTIGGHYYTCETPEPGDGSALDKLMGFFSLESDIDRQLALAMFSTPLWGGPPGTRPAFMLTCPRGRGKGKSTLAQLLALLYGGSIDIGAAEDMGIIKQRLLSPEAAAKRVAILDNVKSHRFSWAELESLLTRDVVNGKRLYVGDASRPNLFTWVITLNGASLSTDMAQRVVEIRLAEPEYSENWEESVRGFIETNRTAILGDLVAFLQREARVPNRLSRWATWDSQVLSRLDQPEECLRLVATRRASVDVEQEESEMIVDYFGSRLRGVGYDTQVDDVFIPSRVAAEWYERATGQRVKTKTAASRALIQLIEEERLWPIVRSRVGPSGSKGFRWIGEHATPDQPIQGDLMARLANRQHGEESEWHPGGDSDATDASDGFPY